MNIQYLSCFIISSLLLSLCQGLSAQYSSNHNLIAEGYAYSSDPHLIGADTETLDSKDSFVNSFCKRLSSSYTGYAIEVAYSDYPLDKRNIVFREFGNIYFAKLSGGGYSYLIKGGFSSKESALKFMNDIIRPKVAKANLFEYNEGIRKIIAR